MHDSEFDNNEFPLAYLITVSSYGTWLDGDNRKSIDRHGLNVYGRRRRPANTNLQAVMRSDMKEGKLILNPRQRAVVEDALKEVCEYRGYDLWAANVRSNHFHAVVSAQSKPEPIANAFKSYSTRRLRESGLISNEVRPWARGRSRRYLWKPKHVTRAINYVLYEQGDIPDFED